MCQLSIISFYFFFQLDTLIFSFFTFTVFLYMFRTGWSIIRRIKCLITQTASGTVPSVVDVSCVAVAVRLSIIVQQDATIYSLLYFCKLLYMFRLVTPRIIRSTYNYNYSIWHWSNRLCYLPLWRRSVLLDSY